MHADRNHWVQRCTNQTTSGIGAHYFFLFAQMSDKWHEMIMILKMVCNMEVGVKCKVRILQLSKDVSVKDFLEMSRVHDKCKGG